MVPWQAVLEDLRRARTRRGREQIRAFAVEGVRLVSRALDAGVEVLQVLIGEPVTDSESPLLARCQAQGVSVQRVPRAVLQNFCDGRASSAALALVRLPESPAPNLANVPLLLVLANVSEPGNVGALSRTALAAGVDALVCSGSSEPHHPKAVRTSMGATFRLPVFRADAPSDLRRLVGSAIEIVVATARGGEPLDAYEFGQRGSALVLGHEGSGVPAAWLDAANRTVTIPMASRVDSFSVNAAAAILLYEAQRQRELRLVAEPRTALPSSG